MKKQFVFLALLGLVASAHAGAAFSSDILNQNKGLSIPLFGSSPNSAPSPDAVVNLDTSEIDTSYYFYRTVEKPVASNIDTVGFVHFSGKDSSGTDSCRVRVIWYGNPRTDGKGIWTKIDSVTYSASGSAASSYAVGTPTPVVNSKGYMALMFTVGNPSNSAVALKSAAKNIFLNRRARLGWVSAP